jgi:hypothetical protein
LLVMPVTASRLTDRAPARAWTRGSPNRRAGALRPSTVVVGCAIRSKILMPLAGRSRVDETWGVAR